MSPANTLLSLLFVLTMSLSAALAEDAAGGLVVPRSVQSAITKTCLDCHGPEVSEGDVRLDEFESLAKDAQ